MSLLYLLTLAAAAQVSDDPAAVCDDDGAACGMKKQLTHFLQQTLAHQDVLQTNQGDMIKTGIKTEQ